MTREPRPGIHTYTVGKGKDRRTIKVRIVKKKTSKSKPKDGNNGTK